MPSITSKWVIGIIASMAVTEAINVIWFSGALPWQPYVKTDWTTELVKGFLLAAVVHDLFHHYHGEVEDAVRAGLMVATLHLAIDHGDSEHHSPGLMELLFEGIRCAIIIAAKILVMFQMRDL